MLSEKQLKSALQAIPGIPLQGLFSRAIELRHIVPNTGGPPKPLYGMGSKVHGARFTPKNSFETVYLGEDSVTALREVEAVIAGLVGLKLTIPTPPWVLIAVKGALSSVLDLTVPANMQKLGTTYQELTGAWRYVPGQAGEPPTHVLGRLCYSSKRFDAIRFPSSKNPPDGVCLAVFPDRLKGASYLEVHDPYRNVGQRIPSGRKGKR